jgi:hypothetical protein
MADRWDILCRTCVPYTLRAAVHGDALRREPLLSSLIAQGSRLATLARTYLAIDRGALRANLRLSLSLLPYQGELNAAWWAEHGDHRLEAMPVWRIEEITGSMP